jgi:hypothetical protein
MRELWRTLPLQLMLLAGCASRTSEVWTKPGVTDVDRQRDQRECVNEAICPDDALAGPVGSLVHIDRGMYETCMARHGYARSNQRQ